TPKALFSEAKACCRTVPQITRFFSWKVRVYLTKTGVEGLRDPNLLLALEFLRDCVRSESSPQARKAAGKYLQDAFKGLHPPVRGGRPRKHREINPAVEYVREIERLKRLARPPKAIATAALEAVKAVLEKHQERKLSRRQVQRIIKASG